MAKPEAAPRSPAHPSPRNVNQEHRSGLGPGERLALAITTHVGTLAFFLIILGWTVIWLGWNSLAPPRLQFDPPTAYVLWLFVSNMIQILLMPLIMLGQNLQGRHAELRAESDYEVNLRAKEEIEDLQRRLAQQQELLERILARLEAPGPGPAGG